jgi:hypothetical protein
MYSCSVKSTASSMVSSVHGDMPIDGCVIRLQLHAGSLKTDRRRDEFVEPLKKDMIWVRASGYSESTLQISAFGTKYRVIGDKRETQDKPQRRFCASMRNASVISSSARQPSMRPAVPIMTSPPVNKWACSGNSGLFWTWINYCPIAGQRSLIFYKRRIKLSPYE